MNPSNYKEDISSSILACAVYAATNTRDPDNPKHGIHFALLREKLSKALFGLSQLQETQFPGWYADPENYGFLARQGGTVFVRVPCHLVPLFPDWNAIERIWEIGVRIRTAPSSILHLSGSNVVRDIFQYVNDIDFCEYVTESSNDIANAIDNTISKFSPPLSCIKIRIADESFLSPFCRKKIKAKAIALDPQDKNNSSFKMDYLLYPEWSERPYEVTNVGIACVYSNGRFQSAGFGKTFAYQQAQITATDVVPTTLSDPDEAGRYVLWLIYEVKKHREDNDDLKMLKRLLSLVRFCYLPDLTERFLELFDNSTMIIDAELKEVERVRLLASEYVDSDFEAFRSTINTALEEYTEDLELQLERYKLRERRIYSDGVSAAIDELVASTAERVRSITRGVLSL